MSDEIPGLVYLPCLKAKEAAEFLDIPAQLLWMLKDANAIPFHQLKPRARILYPKDGLELWWQNNCTHVAGKRGGINE